LPVSLNPSRRGRSFQVLIRMDVSICCVSQPLPAREVISRKYAESGFDFSGILVSTPPGEGGHFKSLQESLQESKKGLNPSRRGRSFQVGCRDSDAHKRA